MNTVTASTNLFAPPVVALGEMVAHRGYLVRFAQRRLRDPMLAEDAVHDVFEAVIAGRAAFGGRAALRTWLTGVLKHKIVDQARRHADTESLDDDAMAQHGVLERASPEAGPDEHAAQRELLQRALARIDALPAPLRDVMRLRVLEDRDTADVCQCLAISEENLFVRLHRARKQLLS